MKILKIIKIVSITIIIILCSLLMIEGEIRTFSNKIIFEGYDLPSNCSFNDISNAIKKDSNENVNLQVKLNYSVNNSFNRSNVKDEEIDEFIKISREYNKSKHTEANLKYLNKLSLKGFLNVYVSKYSPYLYFEYLEQDFLYFYDDLIRKIDSLNIISCVYVKNTEKICNNTLEEAMENGSIIPLRDNQSLSGEGVNIGLLEYDGVVDAAHKNFTGSNLTIRDEWYYTESINSHATQVGSIIGGNHGIATSAHIYSVELFGNMISEIEWLIENNVTLINCSFHLGNYDGIYDSDAGYIDYICTNYWITFVGSAGNDSTNRYIGSPNIGYNVITVGATDVNGLSITNYSSYNVLDGPDKPTIVAPSDFMINNFTSISSGTSFSAPYVTGCIALLMEKYPSLKIYPERVHSIITATANMSSTYKIGNTKFQSGLYSKYGSGFIDFEAAFSAYSTTYSIMRNSDEQGLVFTRAIPMSIGDKFKASLFSIINSDGTTNISFTDYDIILSSPSGSIVTFGGSSTNNLEIIEYIATESGSYILEVMQFSDHGNGEMDNCSVTYYIK